MRLNRWIAHASELSRRAADEAILNGEVSVNGEVVTKLGIAVDPQKDRVAWKGRTLRSAGKHIYIAFYKPSGCLVTKDDPQGRPTIWSLLRSLKMRLNAVGRLDFESEGLLLLTNDGDFLYKLTHPKHEVWKSYHVKVLGEPNDASIAKLQRGIRLEEGQTAPAKVKVVRKERTGTWIDIQIREGKYRQVRRMCEKVGYPVLYLKRMAVGPVKLGRLRPGKWRDLSPREVRTLVEASKR